jgi:hypothetical protein
MSRASRRQNRRQAFGRNVYSPVDHNAGVRYRRAVQRFNDAWHLAILGTQQALRAVGRAVQ